MTGPNNLWTPAEDDIIRANPTLTKYQLAALLPGRSVASSHGRRAYLRRPPKPADAPAPAPIKICHEDYVGMSLTARLMGDPSPSRSALSQRAAPASS